MKYSVKCQIIKKDNSEKKCPIRMRVSYSGVRIDLRLGLSVPANCWDADKEEARTRQADLRQVCAEANARIHEVTAKIDQLFARCEFVDKRPPTINELKSIIDNRVSSSRVSDVFNDYLRDNKHLEINTAETYIMTMNRVVGSLGNVYINEVNQATIRNMIDKFCESLKNSTVELIYIRFRTILRYAQKRGIYTSDGLDYKFKYKIMQRVIVYLTFDELRDMEAYVPESVTEERVRDVFLFCCFTGLRISDAFALKWDDIHDDCIMFTTVKTTDSLTVQLNIHSEQVLQRRREKKDELLDNFVFYKYGNGYFNDILKEMCRKIGFKSPVSYKYYKGTERVTETMEKWNFVTSHTARKTFVVSGITMGLPVTTIMDWTGHKTLKSIDPYLKIPNEVKQKNMAKFNEI